MTYTELEDRLEQAVQRAASEEDFHAALNAIVEELETQSAGPAAVPVILRFMERHPDLDFGTPGPLVHFIERFQGSGYEAELLASVRRRPTTHTTWMLNRLINGAKDREARDELIGAMRAAGAHPEIDGGARRSIEGFLERLDAIPRGSAD